MKPRKLNVELIQKIINQISDDPDSLCMNNFVIPPDLHAAYGLAPKCGTAACIAGWANILQGRSAATAIGHSKEIADELGLSDDKLFFVSRWPKEWRDKYYFADYWVRVKGNNGVTRSQVVIDYLNSIIKEAKE